MVYFNVLHLNLKLFRIKAAKNNLNSRLFNNGKHSQKQPQQRPHPEFAGLHKRVLCQLNSRPLQTAVQRHNLFPVSKHALSSWFLNFRHLTNVPDNLLTFTFS